MTNEEAIEKIKKLLRMKRGGTPGEIENALAMAAKIAREHDIDLAGVDPDEEKQKIGHEDEIFGLKIPLEAKHAANICVRFFNVEICITPAIRLWWMKRKGKVTFVGTAWDIQVARYVFVFLQRHFRYAWTHRQNRRLRNRDAFLFGMALGICAKLQEGKDTLTGDGLIHVGRLKLRRDYFDRLFPNSKTVKLNNDSNANDSKLAGWHEGRKTEIRSGLDKAAPARPALPPAVGQLTML